MLITKYICFLSNSLSIVGAETDDEKVADARSDQLTSNVAIAVYRNELMYTFRIHVYSHI